MSAKKPAEYAPDLFSEHARAAQLGLAVVELMRPWVADEDVDTSDLMMDLVDAVQRHGFLVSEIKRAEEGGCGS